MYQLLSSNETVKSGGISIRIEKFLGGGTQGEVYRSELSENPVAVKWYFPQYLRSDTGLRSRLERAVKDGAPDNRFLWPMSIVTSETRPGFGYVMGLRSPNYQSIMDLVSGKADPSFRTLAVAGFNLADGYYQLHSRGFCYRDISFGNVFFDARTGDILICDNDNVDVDGRPGAIGGTPDFMAPELVLGKSAPSTKTDLHSLAVLLFYMFFIQHPLMGKRVLDIRALDLPARRHLFGEKPVYIFDPVDKSNEAVPASSNDPTTKEGGANALLFWPIYPKFLKDTFKQAFTVGLRDANQRVGESVWRKTMARLIDAAFPCANCGRENFYDETLVDNGTYKAACWSCKAQLKPPMRLQINDWQVGLHANTVLRPHHVNAYDVPSFAQKIGEVAAHPADPSVLGLRNTSAERWVVTPVGQVPQDVLPSQTLRLTPGVKINFGTAQGEIIV